jgi:hypothetical protein
VVGTQQGQEALTEPLAVGLMKETAPPTPSMALLLKNVQPLKEITTRSEDEGEVEVMFTAPPDTSAQLFWNVQLMKEMKMFGEEEGEEERMMERREIEAMDKDEGSKTQLDIVVLEVML